MIKSAPPPRLGPEQRRSPALPRRRWRPSVRASLGCSTGELPAGETEARRGGREHPRGDGARSPSGIPSPARRGYRSPLGVPVSRWWLGMPCHPTARWGLPPTGSHPPPTPPRLLFPAGGSVRKNRSNSELSSGPGVTPVVASPGWGAQPRNGAGCPSVAPTPMGRGAGSPPTYLPSGTARCLRSCTHTPLAKPRLGLGRESPGSPAEATEKVGDRATCHPCPRPSRGICAGTAAQGVSGVPGACWLPARRSRQVPARWDEEQEEEGTARPSP